MAERTVGGYRLLRRLGAGGAGTVWLALDGGGDLVALKLIHPAQAVSADARERLLRETRIVNSVACEGVAHVLDIEVDDAQPFVVTEFVDGPSLSSILDTGPLAPTDLAALARHLHSTLQAVHEAKVVHRDVKPSNIICSPLGPVLIDFGIAMAEGDPRLTSQGLLSGTAGFTAPELLRGQDASPASDWWALAATLLAAATGRQPFGEGASGHVLMRVMEGRADVEGLPSVLVHPLSAALDPDPDRRISPEDMVRELEAAADIEPGTARWDGVPEAMTPDEVATAFLALQTSPEVVPEVLHEGEANAASAIEASAVEDENTDEGGTTIIGADGGEGTVVLPTTPALAETSVLPYSGPAMPAPVAGPAYPQVHAAHEPPPVQATTWQPQERPPVVAPPSSMTPWAPPQGHPWPQQGQPTTRAIFQPVWQPPYTGRRLRKSWLVPVAVAAPLATVPVLAGWQGTIVVACLLVVTTVIGAGDRWLESRRLRNGGPRRSDLWATLGASPLHIGATVLETVINCVFGAVAGLALWAGILQASAHEVLHVPESPEASDGQPPLSWPLDLATSATPPMGSDPWLSSTFWAAALFLTAWVFLAVTWSAPSAVGLRRGTRLGLDLVLAPWWARLGAVLLSFGVVLATWLIVVQS